MTIKPLLGACLLTAIASAVVPSAQAADFRLNPSGHTILMTGPSEPGDEQRLAAVLEQAQALGTRVGGIDLNSLGGDFPASIAVAKAVMRADLETAVPDDASCYGTCLTVFAAGRTKVVFPSSRLAVMAVATLDPTGRTIPDQATTSRLIEIYRRLEMPDTILLKLANARLGEPAYLDARDLDLWGVRTLYPDDLDTPFATPRAIPFPFPYGRLPIF